MRRRVYTHRRRSREPYALRQALRARLELVREAPDQEVDGSCSSWRRGFYCTVSEAKRGSHHKSQQGASTRPAGPTAASAASTHRGGPSGPSRSHIWVKCLPHGQLLRLPARSCHRQNTTGSSFARPLQTTPKPPSATPGMAPQIFPQRTDICDIWHLMLENSLATCVGPAPRRYTSASARISLVKVALPYACKRADCARARLSEEWAGNSDRASTAQEAQDASQNAENMSTPGMAG